jgi:hypothetical protein
MLSGPVLELIQSLSIVLLAASVVITAVAMGFVLRALNHTNQLLRMLVMIAREKSE